MYYLPVFDSQANSVSNYIFFILHICAEINPVGWPDFILANFSLVLAVAECSAQLFFLLFIQLIIYEHFFEYYILYLLSFLRSYFPLFVISILLRNFFRTYLNFYSTNLFSRVFFLLLSFEHCNIHLDFWRYEKKNRKKNYLTFRLEFGCEFDFCFVAFELFIIFRLIELMWADWDLYRD